MKWTLFLPLLCAAVFACAAFKVDTAKLAADEIDCAKQAIRDKLPDVLPEVGIALSGQNAIPSLEAIAVEFGEEVTTCSVAAAEHALAAQASAPRQNALTATGPRMIPTAAPLANARAYLATRAKRPRL